MTKLPMISGRECVDALTKAGFYFVRQKGSHMYLRRDDPFAQISIPNHKELDKGTLKSIIRQADISVDEFITLL